MAESFNNVLLKGATGQPIYPQTLMDNVYVQTAANGTVEGQQTLRQWLALNYVGLSIQVVLSTSEIIDPKANIIYFVPQDDAEAGGYVEYIYILETEDKAAHFEAIGSTDLDLSDYVTDTLLKDALKNYYTKAEADEKFIDTDLIKNYYTKAEADNKFIDTELIANYQPKGDYQPAGDYYTEQEIGYSDTTTAAVGSTKYTTANTVSKRIAAVLDRVGDILDWQDGINFSDYVLVTDIANAERNAAAGEFKYAASIASLVASQFVYDSMNTEIAKGLTIGNPHYANPIAYQVMQTITAMGDDSDPSSATNWLFLAIAGLGFVTDTPADDPGTAPYIVASTAGFGYWFNQTLTEVNNGTYSDTSFLDSFKTYMSTRLEDTGSLALSVLTGVANATGAASTENNVAGDIRTTLGNFSTFGALVVDVSSALEYRFVGLHVPLLFYVAGDIDKTYKSITNAVDTRNAFVTAVNNSIFFTKLHADCKDDVVLMLGTWFENNLATAATDDEDTGSGGLGLAARAGNGIGAACLDTVSSELAAERMAKNWSDLTNIPQDLADSLIKFLALHNFMYYEVILEDTQA